MHQRRASIKAVMVTTTSTSAIQIACRSCHHFQRRCVCPTVVEFVGVKLQRRFLWGGGQDNNKIAWIAWEKVCLLKHKGGLGIKDIQTFNLALLGKWMWNLMQHQGSLWVAVLEAPYGDWRGLLEEGRANLQSIWWRDLKRGIQHSHHGISLQQQLKWKVEVGDKVKILSTAVRSNLYGGIQCPG